MGMSTFHAVEVAAEVEKSEWNDDISSYKSSLSFALESCSFCTRVDSSIVNKDIDVMVPKCAYNRTRSFPPREVNHKARPQDNDKARRRDAQAPPPQSYAP